MSEAARKTRAAARGWTTRASNKLSMLVRNENTTFIELNFELEQYDKRLNTLDEAQLAVELELYVQYLDADIDEASEFRDRVHEARVQAAARLATIASQTTTEAPSEASGTGSTCTTVPRDLLNWSFRCSVAT